MENRMRVRHLFATLVCLLIASTAPVAAQGPALAEVALPPLETAAPSAPVVPAAASTEPAWASKPTRLSLLAAFAALQALDVVTTTKAMNHGGSESNPLVGGMASKPALFISVKAVLTLWTAFATNKLANSGQAKAATITLLAGDAAYAYVVAHNAQVIRQLP
jgi:hypothetical protein